MITLVLGGARSGKSAFGESRAALTRAPVTYVATARRDADAEFEQRIDAHQRRRPASWVLVEASDDLATSLVGLTGTVVLDSLTTWLANVNDFDYEWTPLENALLAVAGDVIIVSDEVGLSLHPTSELGRLFRDALGTLNQAVAAIADEVYFVLAGQALCVKSRPDE